MVSKWEDKTNGRSEEPGKENEEHPQVFVELIEQKNTIKEHDYKVNMIEGNDNQRNMRNLRGTGKSLEECGHMINQASILPITQRSENMEGNRGRALRNTSGAEEEGPRQYWSRGTGLCNTESEGEWISEWSNREQYTLFEMGPSWKYMVLDRRFMEVQGIQDKFKVVEIQILNKTGVKEVDDLRFH